MAIAGLQNFPVLESSILRESQSSVSGRHGNEGRDSTRPSSILQMWRELEDECAVRHADERIRARLQQQRGDGFTNSMLSSNLSQDQESEGRDGFDGSNASESGLITDSEGQLGPQIDRQDHQSITSEQSHDFGDFERERVRQIFREWMNTSGVNAHTSGVAHMNSSSRSQWLGETELERVRIVREWIQMTSQQRDACAGNREDQAAEIGTQIERVRNGHVLDQSEGQTENHRRDFRRLCGRQALLDLLAKKEEERQRELQDLAGHRPVSSFAFRNRIQSLLRIRVFQTKAEHKRPSSAAENELGLLRQRHTVSGLREGFLSRLDNQVHSQASDHSDVSSNNDTDRYQDEQAQSSSAIEGLYDTHEQAGPVTGENEGGPTSDHSDNMLDCTITDRNCGEFPGQVEANLHRDLENGRGERSDLDTAGDLSMPMDDGVWNSQVDSREYFEHEVGESSQPKEDARERAVVHYNPDSDEHNVHDVSSHSDNAEGDASEAIHGQESTINEEEWQEHDAGHEDGEWEGSHVSNQWRDVIQEEIGGTNWTIAAEEPSHAIQESEGGEPSDLQGPYWQDDGSQDAAGDWLVLPSGARASSVERIDPYYFSDEDNVYNMELRELLNRRRVSSLLRSDFRESLDQLIQSYAERQSHVPEDWQLHEMSPFSMQDQDHLRTDQIDDSIAQDGSQITPPSPPIAPSQSHWEQELHHATWLRHEIRQRPGTEWEIINDLRIDMARLQQRLNNMQRMLEACMDMQLELQRSVRQEVSAALNRATSLADTVGEAVWEDSSKFEYVRKGICCVCRESNIDSLLYRCGHMCICTKCANVLVQGNGKCPMCQAPVIDVVRAYFVQ